MFANSVRDTKTINNVVRNLSLIQEQNIDHYLSRFDIHEGMISSINPKIVHELIGYDQCGTNI